MPVTRIRGKSAVHAHGPLVQAYAAAAPLPLHDHNHSPSLSSNHPLLKIESVVPTVGVHHNVRHSRMIRRSHSTVSSAYLRKVTDPRSRTVAALNRCNGAPPTATAAESANGVQDQEKTAANAFPSIKRTKKDKEKFPDRINLDRKGLTAIPLIDDEPQLRLLSLQHNLINVFHVPEIAENAPPPVDEEEKEVESRSPAETSTATSNWDKFGGTGGGGPGARHLENNFSSSSCLSKSTFHGSIGRNRLATGSGTPFHNSGPMGFSSSSSSTLTSTSSTTPSILINGVPNYCSRSLINGKSLQALNINQKLVSKKNPYVQSLYQASVMNGFNCHPIQRTILGNGKSVSDSGICSTSTVSDSSPAATNHCQYRDTLQNLVFLDLYDNQIEKIGNLDGLKNLTVLLLGKNRIVDITGIVCLRNSLRVLDLHGNRIASISHKICRLQELKSLNLAGNALRQIYNGDFAGLLNLRELNLKRNRIKKLGGFEDLQHLERLWLCNNDIHRVEDMSCIAKAINLKEITVENNPVSLAGDCCSFLVSYLPNLMLLSQMHVTEQVKRAAMAWRKSKETTDVNYISISSEVGQSIRREEVISNARTNWELLRSQPQFSVNAQRPGRKEDVRLVEEHLETQPKESIKVEKCLLSSDSQESNESSRDTNHAQPIGTPSSLILANETDCFRLPPILEPHLQLDNLMPTVKTENVSVEDSLGANVDSTSLFSGTSSGSSSRSPSSSRSSGPGSCASELDDQKGDTEPVAKEARRDVGEKPVVKKNDEVPDEEEDEGVRVAFAKTTTSRGKSAAKSHQSVKLEDLKMPTIKISENDYPLDTRSNISVSSSLRPEHSGSGLPDEGTTTSLRSVRNRCPASSRKLLPPSTLASNSSSSSAQIRSQTAKLSPSSSSTLVVVNNNGTSSSSSGTAKTSSQANGAGAQTSAQPMTSAKTHAIDREREQGGDYLIEICGRYLNIYGVGALKFVDKQWNVQKAGDVHTVKFSYINFNSISGILGKIKSRFPNAENFCFRETNMTCLGQLNSLAELQGLQSIVIEPEGNLICTKRWRSYAIFRLSHWGLKQINVQDITETELEEADRLYGQLPDLVLWSLPESLLAPLLSRLRLEEPCNASRLSAKDWLMQAEPSLKCVVGKEALQWRKSPIGNGGGFDESIRIKGGQCFNQMMENTCNAVDKLERLETMWPAMLTDMIRNTLIDYSQLDTYVKSSKGSFYPKTND